MSICQADTKQPPRTLVGVLLALLIAGCTLDEPESTYFSPDATLRQDAAFMAAAHDWAKRWSKATGLDVRIALEGGTPVRAVDADWPSVCARTRVEERLGLSTSTQEIQVDITPHGGCKNMGLAFAHELAHAMAPGPEGHSESGFMSVEPDPDEDTLIDEFAVALVCSEQPCQVFAPEVETTWDEE